MSFLPNSAHANRKYASLIMDAQTGEVLRSRNADKRLHPASLTKIMTLFLTFEAIERGQIHQYKYIPISNYAASQPPSKIGLKAGEQITVRDAVLALITKSANDIAVALAEELAGSEANFARIMTARAQALGMHNTTFRNASGLYHRNQLSTARDMAMLSRAMMQYFPHYYHLFSTAEFKFRGKTYRNHNRLMQQYTGMDGLKTGYIRAAGFNLAASSVRDNRRLIGVVFGGRTAMSRNKHMRNILDQVYTKIDSGTQPSVQYVRNTPPVPDAKPIQFALASSSTIRTPSSPASRQIDITTASLEMGSRDVLPQRESIPQGWSIQVGAFNSAEAGNRAINLAKQELQERLPASAEPVIIPLRTRRGTMFRARITNIDAQTAHAACQHLNDCIVVASR